MIKIRYAAAALVLLGSIQQAQASPMMQIAVDLYGWHVVALALMGGVAAGVIALAWRRP